jgi:acyl carrier protein
MSVFSAFGKWIEHGQRRKAGKYALNYARPRESSEEFVAGCRKKGADCPEEVALGIRRVIARLGMIDESLIGSADTFDHDLVHVPFWDSLDAIGIVLEMEQVFEIEISDRDAETMINPELSKEGTTVADAVTSWGASIARILSQQGRSI